MKEETLERLRYFCQWKIKKRTCDKDMNIIYSADTTRSIGMCQEHFEQFCELQELGKDDEAREKIGLKPRKVSYYQATQQKEV